MDEYVVISSETKDCIKRSRVSFVVLTFLAVDVLVSSCVLQASLLLCESYTLCNGARVYCVVLISRKYADV